MRKLRRQFWVILHSPRAFSLFSLEIVSVVAQLLLFAKLQSLRNGPDSLFRSRKRLESGGACQLRGYCRFSCHAHMFRLFYEALPVSGDVGKGYFR